MNIAGAVLDCVVSPVNCLMLFHRLLVPLMTLLILLSVNCFRALVCNDDSCLERNFQTGLPLSYAFFLARFNLLIRGDVMYGLLTGTLHFRRGQCLSSTLFIVECRISTFSSILLASYNFVHDVFVSSLVRAILAAGVIDLFIMDLYLRGGNRVVEVIDTAQ